MSKKIKITEAQLKTIMERRHTYQAETNEEEVTDIEQVEDKDQEVPETEETPINESIEGFRKSFNRFIK